MVLSDCTCYRDPHSPESFESPVRTTGLSQCKHLLHRHRSHRQHANIPALVVRTYLCLCSNSCLVRQIQNCPSISIGSRPSPNHGCRTRAVRLKSSPEIGTRVGTTNMWGELYASYRGRASTVGETAVYNEGASSTLKSPHASAFVVRRPRMSNMTMLREVTGSSMSSRPWGMEILVSV